MVSLCTPDPVQWCTPEGLSGGFKCAGSEGGGGGWALGVQLSVWKPGQLQKSMLELTGWKSLRP